MADAFTSPEGLIAELEEAASEFAPADAAAFGAEARDELAAYRELLLQPIREPIPEPEGETHRYRGPRIAVPESYQARAEIFVVFETFVRFFVDPVVVAGALPGLLARPDSPVERLVFARFGEEPEPTGTRELATLSADARELTAMAANLGRVLFGDLFRESDFWTVRE